MGTACSQPIRQDAVTYCNEHFSASNQKVTKLLSSTLPYASDLCCRMIVNNDMPKGAAHIPLVAVIRYIQFCVVGQAMWEPVKLMSQPDKSVVKP